LKISFAYFIVGHRSGVRYEEAFTCARKNMFTKRHKKESSEFKL
jgi:hypothetical protein